MNLVNLQTFLKIAESGSLVRASEVLNVTQSTVTARLKSLEEELGQRLFNRHKSGATLTAPGYKLKRYAEVMLGLWRQVRLETSLPKEIEAVCNVGCHMDLWPNLGRDLLTELRGRHPRTAVSLWPGEQAELDQWLGLGLVDVALAYRPVVHGNQTVHRLKADELVLYSDRMGSPARFDPGYVYVDAGQSFYSEHATEYADADVARTSFGSAVWALDYLTSHGGSAYLPRRLGDPLIKTGALFVVDGAPVFSRNVYVVTNDRTIANWPVLIDWIASHRDGDVVTRTTTAPAP